MHVAWVALCITNKMITWGHHGEDEDKNWVTCILHNGVWQEYPSNNISLVGFFFFFCKGEGGLAVIIIVQICDIIASNLKNHIIMFKPCKMHPLSDIWD